MIDNKNLGSAISDTLKQSQEKPETVNNESKGPRTFTWGMKEDCWKSSSLMLGRDPERWRLDAYGIPVSKALRGCQGLFCHEYDHIIPYSKGGKTELNNCQILQTKLNRLKSNKTDMTFSELRNHVPNYKYSELEMDIIERAVYGNIKKPDLKDFVIPK